MRKMGMVLALTAIFSTSYVFADDMPAASGSSEAKPCKVIAEACKSAGFTRSEAAGKNLWKDCMKPVLMGQTVSGVTVDADTIKACKAHKIEKAKKEAQEFQNSK